MKTSEEMIETREEVMESDKKVSGATEGRDGTCWSGVIAKDARIKTGRDNQGGTETGCDGDTKGRDAGAKAGTCWTGMFDW